MMCYLIIYFAGVTFSIYWIKCTSTMGSIIKERKGDMCPLHMYSRVNKKQVYDFHYFIQ